MSSGAPFNFNDVGPNRTWVDSKESWVDYADIARAGYEGVEIFDGNLLDETPADLRRKLADAGLELPTPGHTPGTISAFITVKAQGQEYWSAFWGGKGMRPDIDRSRQMFESSVVFAEESDALGVRIPLNTHGWGDATFSRLIEHVLMPEAPNPFVVTVEQAEANNKILEHCTAAYLDAVESGAIKPRS